MPELSTKPYMVRAIHQWCMHSGYTPYLSVKVDEDTRVPMEFVKKGEIVLNVSYDATHQLTIENEQVQFSARFSGTSRQCYIPMSAVAGIFARENGQGLFFPPEPMPEALPSTNPKASGEDHSVTLPNGRSLSSVTASPLDPVIPPTDQKDSDWVDPPQPPSPPASPTRPKLKIVK